MEAGIYITFFDAGEPADRELPPVGPLEHVVLRHRQLVAERRAVPEAPDMAADISRWLEAELELQRTTGEEPGGPKRGEMRLVSRDGVYLRFAIFGDTRERDLIPELGPYAVVVIGHRGVEADGQLLAARGSTDLAAWDLSSHAGAESAGRHKPDIAFRTASTGYHPQITPAPPRAHPVIERVAEPAARPAAPAPEPATPARTPAPAAAPTPLPVQAPPPIVLAPAEPIAPRAAQETTPTPLELPAAPLELPPAPVAPEAEPLFRPSAPRDREPYAPPVYTPATEEPSALTAEDLALIKRIEQQRAEETLRARIQEEERRRLGVDDAEDEASTWAMRYRTQAAPAETVPEAAAGGATIGALLWRMRFAIIGILLLGVGAYGFTFFRTGGVSGVPGQQPMKIVGIAQKFSSTRWDYIVNGTQRVPTAGTASARGVYYVVRIGITNKGTEGAQLSPSDFVLLDANGTEYRAEALESGAYYGPNNTQSQFVWPQSFAIGKSATVAVVFDVDPTIPRGTLLEISDLPTTRVKLD